MIQTKEKAVIDKQVTEELQRFGITFGGQGSGFGAILDKIYDALSAQIADAATQIGASFQQ